MTRHLKLRIHISEPFDFERQAGRAELEGWTADHEAPGEEWEVHLEPGFDFRDHHYGRVLVSPLYVGEHLARVHDAFVGFPVRIAHRRDGDWHYAMTGMLAIRRDDEQPAPTAAPANGD